jgi:hypothetical protein
MADLPTPVRYVPEEHFAQVDQWHKEWNQTVTPDALPKVGFIVPGLAVGFLYQTDSSVGMIETFIVPKNADKVERGKAIDAIILAIIAEARRLGFKSLLGSTQLDAMVKRVERLGFTYAGGGYHLVAYGL